MQNKTDSRIHFALKNSFDPVWPERMMRRFLDHLISSDEMVIEIFHDKKRIALAVLIDKISNPANLANLEILGVDPEFNSEQTSDEILSLAIKKIRPPHCGLQITFTETCTWREALVQKYRLEFLYSTFEMQNTGFSYSKISEDKIHLTSSADEEILYAILTESFSNNLETSIPDFASWSKMRVNNQDNLTWTIHDCDRPVGFINLGIDSIAAKAEIKTVGVLPAYRGRGYGQLLMKKALNHLCKVGVHSCSLTVAVQNEAALGIYQSLGFIRKQKYDAYRSASR